MDHFKLAIGGGERLNKMLRMVFWLVIALLMLAVVANVFVRPPESHRASNGALSGDDGLLKAAISGNTSGVLKALNKIKRDGSPYRELSLVMNLWSEEKAVLPSVNWAMIEQDAVRVNLADVMVQANLNGEKVPQLASIHDYVRGVVIQSREPEVVSTALLVLSLLDSPEDVNLIRRAAGRSSEMQHVAVIALGKMCSSSAALALDDLRAHLSDNNAIADFEATRTQAEAIKSAMHRCTAEAR